MGDDDMNENFISMANGLQIPVGESTRRPSHEAEIFIIIILGGKKAILGGRKPF